MLLINLSNLNWNKINLFAFWIGFHVNLRWKLKSVLPSFPKQQKPNHNIIIDLIHFHRESAKNGHGHAAYNLVAGHLQGYNTDVQDQYVLLLFYLIFFIMVMIQILQFFMAQKSMWNHSSSFCTYCYLFSEIEPLLKSAHEQGVEEAERALHDMYPHRYWISSSKSSRL